MYTLSVRDILTFLHGYQFKSKEVDTSFDDSSKSKINYEKREWNEVDREELCSLVIKIMAPFITFFIIVILTGQEPMPEQVNLSDKNNDVNISSTKFALNLKVMDLQHSQCNNACSTDLDSEIMSHSYYLTIKAVAINEDSIIMFLPNVSPLIANLAIASIMIYELSNIPNIDDKQEEYLIYSAFDFLHSGRATLLTTAQRYRYQRTINNQIEIIDDYNSLTLVADTQPVYQLYQEMPVLTCNISIAPRNYSIRFAFKVSLMSENDSYSYSTSNTSSINTNGSVPSSAASSSNTEYGYTVDLRKINFYLTILIILLTFILACSCCINRQCDAFCKYFLKLCDDFSIDCWKFLRKKSHDRDKAGKCNTMNTCTLSSDLCTPCICLFSDEYEIIDFFQSVADKWEDIGRCLKVDDQDLDKIKRDDNRPTPADKLQAVIRKAHSEQPITWRRVHREVLGELRTMRLLLQNIVQRNNAQAAQPRIRNVNGLRGLQEGNNDVQIPMDQT